MLWPNVLGPSSGPDVVTFTEKYLNALWGKFEGPFFVTLRKPGEVCDHELTMTLDKYGYKLKFGHKVGSPKRPFYHG